MTTTTTGFYNAAGQPMTKAAYFALKAATLREQIGTYAAMRYAVKNGSTLGLYRLARQLLAVEKKPLDFIPKMI